MSILQDYKKIRQEIGQRKYNAIEKYLEQNKNLLLSDIYYKKEEWDKFENWYSENISKLELENKPKCALISAGGNIFNLMGMASRTLKDNGMQVESKEMVERVTSSKSYSEALSIIGEYVEITDEQGLEEEDEYE